jgi:glycosyltransferase involved in cell wall biosynthesis
MLRLRIGLNATAAVSGGGLTYWLNLLPELGKVAPQHQFILFVSAKQKHFGADLPANFEVQRLNFKNIAHRLVWEQLKLPRILKEQKIDVLLSPAELCPLFAPCPVVMAIRNVMPYVSTPGINLKTRARQIAFRAISRLSAARAEHVFFVSEASRQLVSPYLRLPLAKSSVVYHGLAPRFYEPSAPAELPAQPYILAVSVVYAHKGFETLLEAFARLKKTSDAFSRHQLVIAGALVDQEYYGRLKQLIEGLGISEAVRFTGDLPYHALPQLYRQADMFVFPSRAESFGHPLVEAMASGVPQVVTALPVTLEICGDAACYFPAGDAPVLAAQLEILATQPESRARQVQCGLNRARYFSWERCATQTVTLLEKTAESSRSALAESEVTGRKGALLKLK